MYGRYPDWVMLGAPTDNGVMVIASKTLSHAELEVEMRYEEVWLDYFNKSFLSGPQKITLTVHMDNYVMIMGPDYNYCFKTLFEQWKPEATARQELESRRAIES